MNERERTVRVLEEEALETLKLIRDKSQRLAQNNEESLTRLVGDLEILQESIKNYCRSRKDRD